MEKQRKKSCSLPADSKKRNGKQLILHLVLVVTETPAVTFSSNIGPVKESLTQSTVTLIFCSCLPPIHTSLYSSVHFLRIFFLCISKILLGVGYFLPYYSFILC